MERMGIISVDGHVTGSRAEYREFVDPEHLEAYDEWVHAIEALPFELGNLKPELGSDSQWDSDKRVRDLESAGVVGEVLFSNGLPFQAIPFVDAAAPPDPEAGSPRLGRSSTGGCPILPRPARPAGRHAVGVLRRRRAGGGRHRLGEGARAGRDHDAGALDRAHASSSIPSSTPSGRRARTSTW